MDGVLLIEGILFISKMIFAMTKIVSCVIGSKVGTIEYAKLG